MANKFLEVIIMTLHETATEIYNLALNHRVNGAKRSLKWVEEYVSRFIGPNVDFNRSTNHAIMMFIDLPDGEWYIIVTRFRNGEFDFSVPDTREQEKRMTDKFMEERLAKWAAEDAKA